jgi:hypothetical protein
VQFPVNGVIATRPRRSGRFLTTGGGFMTPRNGTEKRRELVGYEERRQAVPVEKAGAD